jgi:hypothetical protein
MANVIPIFVAPTSSLLHHNDVRVTYPTIFNLRMEPIRSIPLHSMAMPQSMVIITKAPFVTTLVHIAINMRSRPQTPRETQLVSVHIEMPMEVDKLYNH